MKLFVSGLASLLLPFLLIVSCSNSATEKDKDSIRAYQQLEDEWINKTDSAKAITSNQASKYISKFWELRNEYANSSAASKSTIKALEIAENTNSFQALDTLFNKVSIHEDAMVELVHLVPRQANSRRASIENLRRIYGTSKNSAVQAAAMFQTILMYSMYGKNLQAAMLIDSLQSKHGITSDHEKYGEDLRRFQQTMASHALGKKLGNFITTEIDGERITYNNLKGKVTILYFHGTGCVSCITMYPKLNRIYKKFKDNDFLLLGIAADGAYYSEEKFRKFLHEHSIKWPQTLNIDHFDNYNVNFLSTAFLLNKKGKIVRTSRSEEILQSIDKLGGKNLNEAIEYLLES